MKSKINIQITDAEWEIMRVVWANGVITSREIIDILEEKKEWKAATIKTLIGRLVEKEALQTRKEGRKFIYSAAVSEDESMRMHTQDILARVCKKDSGNVIWQIIDSATLSHSDILVLEELLAQKKETALEEVPCDCAVGQCECHLY